MKKSLSLILALALVLSLCLAGFAEDGSGLDPIGQPDPITPPPAATDPGPEPTVPSTVIPIPDPSSEPSTPSSEPSTPSSEPSTPSSEPSTPSSEPTTPSSEPTTPSSEPTTPSSEPTTPSSESTAPSTDPSTDPPTNPPTNPPTWNPQPTTPTTSGLPKVTKHPVSETVKEGGFAEFVSRADNCTSIIWHLQSPGGGTDVLAKDAPNRFPGLIVTGLESERLGLDRIPKGLDEWRVRAEFVGRNGNVWSEPAVISVINQELAAPTIQTQPKGAELNSGEATTLRVVALSSEQNTSLTYQWYKNTINSNVGGKAILGATADTYTPSFTQGTVYYYCAVRCTNGSDVSVATKTVCAPVTYTGVGGDATTQPSTAPAATLAPWGSEPETTEQTEETTLPVPTQIPTRSNTLLVVIVVVIVVIAVLGILAAVLILRFYGGRDDYEEPVEIPKATRRSSRQSPREEPVEIPKAVRRTPKQPPKEEPVFSKEDDEWDDLSDLEELNFLLDDIDDL